MSVEVYEPRREDEGPPPVFRRWGQLYTAVLVYLLLLIVTFYLFAQAYRA